MWQQLDTHLCPGPALQVVGRSSGGALCSWKMAHEQVLGEAEVTGWVSRGTQLPVWAQSFAASQPLAWTHMGGCWAPEPAQPGGAGVGLLHGT